ncbi:MAG: pilus assembly protein TadG-related protein, partial [Anaerolineales bacterium]
MHTKKRRSRQATRSQRGQILILVVFGIVGFVAFVGLVVDTGLVFIANGTLRRSVDAAALAAASQYRKNPDPTGLEKAADEFLTLNNVSNASATVHVCNTVYPTYHDPNLCTPP